MTAKMLHSELVRQLYVIAERQSDPERNHAEADLLLLKWIEEHAGSDAATRAFDAIRKWYA